MLDRSGNFRVSFSTACDASRIGGSVLKCPKTPKNSSFKPESSDCVAQDKDSAEYICCLLLFCFRFLFFDYFVSIPVICSYFGLGAILLVISWCFSLIVAVKGSESSVSLSSDFILPKFLDNWGKCWITSRTPFISPPRCVLSYPVALGLICDFSAVCSLRY